MSALTPTPSVQRDLLRLLRDERPSEAAPGEIEAALGKFECGGYLHDQWARAGRLAELPPSWAAALARAHRKTAIDTLAALAELKSLLPILDEERVPFLLLKGGAYLADLYDDPGCRALTDIDLLIRPADAGRLARRLAGDGFVGESAGYEPRFRRFEMWRPRPGEVRLEFHWWLGMPRRFRFSQEDLWARSTRCHLEGSTLRRLGAEDALLYHVAHQADHYFGPSLKWLLDLRQMFRRWEIDADVVRSRAAVCRVRTPLALALEHLERLLPGATPKGLRRASQGLGKVRRCMLRPYLSREALLMFDTPTRRSLGRYALRLLLVDHPADIAALTLEGCLRPLSLGLDRLLGRGQPPWAWAE